MGDATPLSTEMSITVPASELAEDVTAGVCVAGDCVAEDASEGDGDEPHAAATATAAPIRLALNQIQLLPMKSLPMLVILSARFIEAGSAGKPVDRQPRQLPNVCGSRDQRVVATP
jgi:hypothetical protein